MLNALGIQNSREAIGFITCVVPFAGAEDDAHVIVFPRVVHIWQIFIRAIEVNVVVVITVEERANIERPAQADKETDGVGMTKGNVGRVISAETGSANCDSMATALPPRKIE